MDSEYVERYDRQIRLWGKHGQSKFSSAKVCLIHANALGTEILKGLCLAGIGGFTILDPNKVTPDDIESNFFLPPSSLATSRAEAAKQNLLELGDNIVGEVKSLEKHLPHPSQSVFANGIVEPNTEFWKQFNVVVVAGFLCVDHIKSLSHICWQLNVPLIIAKSTGFFAHSQTQVKEHEIIESHNENVQMDFNLDAPFPELKAYFNSINLECCDAHKQGSYPFIVIIYKYLKQWQVDNGHSESRLPEDYAEKNQLRDMIKEAHRKVIAESNDKIHEFENYIEALKAINLCLKYSVKLPSATLKLFDDQKISQSSTKDVTSFWSIIRAIKEFTYRINNGALPEAGRLPDMHSSSEEYSKVQKLFSFKAKQDVDAVFDIVHSYQDSSFSPTTHMSIYEETRLLCKNIKTVSVLRTSPIYEEWENKCLEIKCQDDDYQNEYLAIHLGLKAMDLFYSTYARLPGSQDDDHIETDLTKLKQCAKSILGKSASTIKMLDQCLYELCRCGGIELHVTSAFIGGCVAQEIIKLITNQYQPANNIIVYNAITASTSCFCPEDVFLLNMLQP